MAAFVLAPIVDVFDGSFVESLMKSGFTGKPADFDGDVLENVLNGLLIDPKVEPLPEASVLLGGPNPKLFLEEAGVSAANPPAYEAGALDPNVFPKAVLGFAATEVVVVVSF